MDVIQSKRTLHSILKECLEDAPEDKIVFPKVLKYCEGMGDPVFKITIEKHTEDYFIDAKGQKWVKAS